MSHLSGLAQRLDIDGPLAPRSRSYGGPPRWRQIVNEKQTGVANHCIQAYAYAREPLRSAPIVHSQEEKRCARCCSIARAHEGLG